MGDGPQLPGDWDASGSGEPPAQLLRRAISHVESLLHRLESPSDKGDAGAHPAVAVPPGADDTHHTDDTDAAGGTDGADEVGGGSPDEAPTVPDDVATPGDPVSADNVRDFARPGPWPESGVEPVVASAAAPQRAPVPDESEYVPLAGVSSTAQAEALRITLHAHEQAHRLSAEANTMRAQAAADGERILVEARMLSDRLHVESRDRATDLLAAAKHEAAALIDAARAESDHIRHLAVEEAEAARAGLLQQAQREREEARQAVLEQAERDAEALRAGALEAGRAEAERLVEAELATAAEESRRTVAESHTRALGVLDAANDSADDVRASMRRVIDQLGESLADFDASVAAAQVLRETVDELTPSDDADDGPADGDPADGDPADGDPADGARRPLGLLFGAPRG